MSVRVDRDLNSLIQRIEYVFGWEGGSCFSHVIKGLYLLNLPVIERNMLLSAYWGFLTAFFWEKHHLCAQMKVFALELAYLDNKLIVYTLKVDYFVSEFGDIDVTHLLIFLGLIIFLTIIE